MIEKPKRPKKLNNQDRKIPINIQELINRYDLENKDIYDYLDYLVESLSNSIKLLDEEQDDIEKKLNYSMTEQVIGEWLDSKPLYRKVVNLGVLPNNNTKAVAHDIQNLKRIVKLEGFAGSGLNKGGITLPHATSTPVALYADDTNVSVKTTSDATGYTEAYAFVYYTKTTD